MDSGTTLADNKNPLGHSGFVSIIGRPSAGKSTLLNALCGQKVSIVSPAPQTTKNKIRGILTRGLNQLVFVDTPGYHDSDKRLNNRLKDLAIGSLVESDAVVYVIDATRPAGPEEEHIAEIAKGKLSSLVIAINKLDDPKAKPFESRRFIEGFFGPVPIFELSAKTGKGVEALAGALFSLVPEGPLYYPEEFYTDQEPEFRITEIIREKAMLKVRDELPHAIYVEIEDTYFDEEKPDRPLMVRASLCVERDSQKGMLIGKGASMIKAIRQEAEKDLAELFPYPVLIELQVKVKKNWKQEDKLIRRLYY